MTSADSKEATDATDVAGALVVFTLPAVMPAFSPQAESINMESVSIEDKIFFGIFACSFRKDYVPSG